MELFRLLGTIAIDNTKAISKLKETNTQAQNTSDKLANTFTNIGQKAIDLGNKMQGMSIAAGVAFGGIIKSAANVKAQEAQFEAAFGSLQGKAKETFKSIGEDTGILATRLQVEGTKAFSQFKGAGLDATDALKQTDKFTRLAADGAAYYDMSLEETSELMRSFIRGNTEAGDRIGLFTSETQRNERAVELLGKKYLDCTEAEKQMVMMDIASSIYETSGAMGQAARESDGWENVIGNFKDSVVRLAASIGETILPSVTKFVKKATDFVQKIQKMDDGTKKFIAVLTGVVAAASPVLTVFGKVTTTFGKVMKATSRMKTYFLSSVTAVNKYRTATEGASLAAGVMNGNLTKGQAAVGGVATKFGSLLANMSPVAIGLTGITTAAGVLAVGMYELYQNTHAETIAAQEFADTHEKSIEKINMQNGKVDEYAKRLDELTSKEDKSAQDKKLIQEYVDKLNESVDGLNLEYDEEYDKLNKTKDAIYEKIDAMKEEALESAYIEQSKESLDKYTESKIKLTEAEDELAAFKEKTKGMTQDEINASDALRTKQRELQGSVDDLKEATSEYWKTYTKESNMAAMSSGAWDEVVKEAEASGIKIPESLTKGIKEGKYVVPSSVDELNELIDFDKGVKKADEGSRKIVKTIEDKLRAGDITTKQAIDELNNLVDFNKAAEKAKGDAKKTVNNLRDQLANGEISVTDATKKLNKAIDKEMEKMPPKANEHGKNNTDEYSKGMRDRKGKAKTAGKEVGESGKSGINSVGGFSTIGANKGSDITSGLHGKRAAARTAGKDVGEAGKSGAKSVSGWYSVGSNMGSGIASGIRGMIDSIAGAAKDIVTAAKNAANKAANSHSPSKLFRDEVGRYIGQGVAVGIEDEIPTVETAAQHMIKAANVAATYSIDGSVKGMTQNPDSNSMTASAANKSIDESHEQIELLKEILFTMRQINETIVNHKIQWNDRELGRFVKNYA